MNTGFHTLWTIAVSHAFHGGVCDALAFVVPPATQEALKAMRAMAREIDGRLHVLIEQDTDGQALIDSTGRTLVFGLMPRSSSFVQYTGDMGLAKGQQALFANSVSIDTVDAQPTGVRITSSRITITPLRDERPLTLRVITANGLPKAHTTLAPTDASWQWDAGMLQGEVQITEEAQPGVVLAQQRLFIAPGLTDCWGVLSLTVSSDHMVHGHDFTLALPAREDVLRYYVLVKPANQADFDSIQIQDQGAATDSRSPLTFTRHVPPFGQGRLSPDLLDPGHTRQLVLFEASAPIARQARGPHGIALQRQGEVLIGDLPQPGADRSDAQFVVHLSKP